MFKYKREINNYDRAKNIEYSLSDNAKVCFCMSGTLKSTKPYHGMYIKDSKRFKSLARKSSRDF